MLRLYNILKQILETNHVLIHFIVSCPVIVRHTLSFWLQVIYQYQQVTINTPAPPLGSSMLETGLVITI